MSNTKKSGGVSGAVLAGVLLVPATAVVAVAIVGVTSRPPVAEASVVDTTTTSVSIEDSTTTTESDREDSSIEDACTDGAADLLAKEAAGELTELETAALDALRSVCDEQGLTIAGPPAPEPIVRTVTVKDTSVSTSPTTIGDRHDDDDEYEDHEDEDDHHEYEDHEEDEEDHHEDEDEEDEDEEDEEDD